MAELEAQMKRVEIRALPHFNQETWGSIKSFLESEIKELSDLSAALQMGPGGLLEIEGLRHFIKKEMGDEERAHFFTVILPFMQRLVLDLPALFPEKYIPILRPHRIGSLDLTRHQAACLLACCFFCLFPEVYGGLNDPNFATLFYIKGVGSPKLRCLFHYFDRLATDGIPDGSVTFHRQALSNDELRSLSSELLESSTAELTNFTVHSEGAIEDAKDAIQVDFANEYIGGGVLGGGCVQEEIRFMVCPECLCSLIFCPIMRSEESIVIIGAEQFSSYSGYAFSFRWAAPFHDETPKDKKGRVASALTAIDALVAFSTNQFSLSNIKREITKAYSGFSIPDDILQYDYQTIATGNWGCGAFGGDIPLKSMIQWLAASLAKRNIDYYTFKNKKAAQLPEVLEVIKSQGFNVGDLYRIIMKYGERMRNIYRATNKNSLFAYIIENYGTTKEASSEAPKLVDSDDKGAHQEKIVAGENVDCSSSTPSEVAFAE